MAILEIENLTVAFRTNAGPFAAVENIDVSVDKGELLAIVGESGSGKSVAMLAVMGLLPWTANVTADRMTFKGRDLLGMSSRERRALNGRKMAMIFQEPMSSLNPCFTVGAQIEEALRLHTDLDKAARKRKAIALLEQVGIPDPSRRHGAYPHQMSGGMSQRAMIAMALAADPELLIADEPTTALDVTIQAQILDLLVSLQKERGMALILITHDMAVVAETAERVSVHYAGRRMEVQNARDLFERPAHPYTAALMSALPERSEGAHRLPVIPGVVPGQFDRPSGCVFSPRCALTREICRALPPKPQGPAQALCHFPIGGPS